MAITIIIRTNIVINRAKAIITIIRVSYCTKERITIIIKVVMNKVIVAITIIILNSKIKFLKYKYIIKLSF